MSQSGYIVIQTFWMLKRNCVFIMLFTKKLRLYYKLLFGIIPLQTV